MPQHTPEETAQLIRIWEQIPMPRVSWNRFKRMCDRMTVDQAVTRAFQVQLERETQA